MGKPVIDWPVVHGDPESFYREALDQLMTAAKNDEAYSYTIPSTYRKDVKLAILTLEV
ncbi:hypothetical protein [Agarilytica rhodophyticola]|uniref:hypothetical protein n=1 Tax=Agarilytica rhodophyticola TaxID=1737490 RepID=UPI0013154543|nr:hypothetical protein [Agarilytica rhodophyticola]